MQKKAEAEELGFSRKYKKCFNCSYELLKPGEFCPAKNQKCHRCGKIGQFKNACKSTRQQIKQISIFIIENRKAIDSKKYFKSIADILLLL